MANYIVQYNTKIVHSMCVFYLHVHHTQQTWLSPRQTLVYNCEHPVPQQTKRHIKIQTT